MTQNRSKTGIVVVGSEAGGAAIAKACVFLLSDRASYMNAGIMQVDGGQAESKMIHTPGRNWGGIDMSYTQI